MGEAELDVGFKQGVAPDVGPAGRAAVAAGCSVATGAHLVGAGVVSAGTLPVWPALGSVFGVALALGDGLGLGVGLALGVGSAVALALGVGSAVALGLGVGSAVALALGVGLGLGVALAVGVGFVAAVGVGVAVALGVGFAAALGVGRVLTLGRAVSVALGFGETLPALSATALATAFFAAAALSARAWSFAAFWSRLANPGIVKYVEELLVDAGVCMMVPTEGLSALIIRPPPM
ncbi:hypothetical protein [Arthrobacter dokdonensis]|uniref:hypothetical protein n=1 Tax=Arthrobacter dokdonellae TaxID=2211210 RepID=UPI00149495BA|nr:hypothetical protein [Arthrobacter dokdonellae]